MIDQRTHAAGAAIVMAMPVMAIGTENLSAPSMATAAPTAATARPNQSGSTFQVIFLSFHHVRIVTIWAIRHEQTGQGLSIFLLPWRERVRVREAFFGQMTRCLTLSPPS